MYTKKACSFYVDLSATRIYCGGLGLWYYLLVIKSNYVTLADSWKKFIFVTRATRELSAGHEPNMAQKFHENMCNLPGWVVLLPLQLETVLLLIFFYIFMIILKIFMFSPELVFRKLKSFHKMIHYLFKTYSSSFGSFATHFQQEKWFQMLVHYSGRCQKV
jgi:hypothetical protein